MRRLVWAPVTSILCSVSRVGVLASALTGICLAQASSGVSLSNGLQLQIATDLGHPTGQQTITVEMARASGDSFYRIFWDQNHLAVYAYEIAFSVADSGGFLNIAVKPAGLEFANRFPDADRGKPTPTLSEQRQLPPLGFGKHVEIPVFKMEGLGLDVVDSVTVNYRPDGEAPSSLGRIRLAGLTIKINGTPIAVSADKTPVAGRYAVFYLPGRGAYFLSPAEVPGSSFLNAGWIDGNQIQFTLDNILYEITASQPILTGSQRGELWVFHDPAYKPAGNWTKPIGASATKSNPFFAGASDSLDWWLP